MGDSIDPPECPSRPQTSDSTDNADDLSTHSLVGQDNTTDRDSPPPDPPHTFRVETIRRSSSADSAQPRVPDPASRKKPADSSSKTADWTAKLKKAQLKIEAVCPFCRHVICSQKCQDKQCLRYAWDVWAEAAELLDPYGLPRPPPSSRARTAPRALPGARSGCTAGSDRPRMRAEAGPPRGGPLPPHALQRF
jgi:hypothetical protein